MCLSSLRGSSVHLHLLLFPVNSFRYEGRPLLHGGNNHQHLTIHQGKIKIVTLGPRVTIIFKRNLISKQEKLDFRSVIVFWIKNLRDKVIILMKRDRFCTQTSERCNVFIWHHLIRESCCQDVSYFIQPCFFIKGSGNLMKPNETYDVTTDIKIQTLLSLFAGMATCSLFSTSPTFFPFILASTLCTSNLSQACKIEQRYLSDTLCTSNLSQACKNRRQLLRQPTLQGNIHPESMTTKHTGTFSHIQWDISYYVALDVVIN